MSTPKKQKPKHRIVTPSIEDERARAAANQAPGEAEKKPRPRRKK